MKKKDNEEVQVLKTGSCPSLSGKSTLGYEVGRNSDAVVQLRVATNTGTGYFSKDWVPWQRVQSLLDKNGTKPITSHTLSPIFQGQSTNNAGFLLAVMRHEGMVRPMADKPRCHELIDTEAFSLSITALEGAPAGTSKKTPAKPPLAAKNSAPKAPSVKRK